MHYNVQALFEYQQAQWLCDTVLSEVTKVLKTRSRTYVWVTTWNVSKLLLLPLFSLLMYLSVVAQKKPSSVTHTYPLNHLNTYMFVLTYIHLRLSHWWPQGYKVNPDFKHFMEKLFWQKKSSHHVFHKHFWFELICLSTTQNPQHINIGNMWHLFFMRLM